MKFYQELQLNQKGSKELIKNSQTTKEKLYHIAVYLLKLRSQWHSAFSL